MMLADVQSTSPIDGMFGPIRTRSRWRSYFQSGRIISGPVRL